MSGKYDMRICKCGRIHMVDNESLDKALENNKNLLLICAGCGNATLLGADIEPDWDNPNKSCYMMYSAKFSPYRNAVIQASNFEPTERYKGIEKIIYSHGYKVPMMTGMYANGYFNGRFSDNWYPDFWEIERGDITVDEIMVFINEYKHNRTTVNMRRFIHETPDDVLEVIAHYHIDGLNFKDTKWENEWNSK